jgi:hypothetical protein
MSSQLAIDKSDYVDPFVIGPGEPLNLLVLLFEAGGCPLFNELFPFVVGIKQQPLKGVDLGPALRLIGRHQS